jgi:hypothetical protein
MRHLSISPIETAVDASTILLRKVGLSKGFVNLAEALSGHVEYVGSSRMANESSIATTSR